MLLSGRLRLRVADLKADKEHLESLSKEKAHADKLRARIVELNNTITSKQLQYDDIFEATRYVRRSVFHVSVNSVLQVY